MNFAMFATWVLVGLATGWLAGAVRKGGGHGRGRDVILGVIGSSAASAIMAAVRPAAEMGMVATALVAFAGAAIVLVAQRTFWDGHAEA